MTITHRTASYELYSVMCDKCKKTLEDLINLSILHSYAKSQGWHLDVPGHGDLCEDCYKHLVAEGLRT